MERWPSLVDGNSLENCQGGNLLEGSNPSLSALKTCYRHDPIGYACRATRLLELEYLS